MESETWFVKQSLPSAGRKARNADFPILYHEKRKILHICKPLQLYARCSPRFVIESSQVAMVRGLALIVLQACRAQVSFPRGKNPAGWSNFS